MFEGETAKLQMKAMILEDGFFDPASYPCKVVTFRDDELCCLISEEADLPVFSRDATYWLTIKTKANTYDCSGTVEDRYWNKEGRIIVFRVQSGFYLHHRKL